MAGGGYAKEKFWKAGGYGKFAAPGHWQQQLRYPSRPVVEVSWYEAAAYCAWAEGRLPTETEWECAARGGREGARYPWGNETPDQFRANYAEGGPGQLTPVGMYPEGATRQGIHDTPLTGVCGSVHSYAEGDRPQGIHDLAGNVYEWTADWWGRYSKSAAKNPKGPENGESKVLRGGSWHVKPRRLRVSHRDGDVADVRYGYVGFRCVRELLSL